MSQLTIEVDQKIIEEALLLHLKTNVLKNVSDVTSINFVNARADKGITCSLTLVIGETVVETETTEQAPEVVQPKPTPAAVAVVETETANTEQEELPAEEEAEQEIEEVEAEAAPTERPSLLRQSVRLPAKPAEAEEQEELPEAEIPAERPTRFTRRPIAQD